MLFVAIDNLVHLPQHLAPTGIHRERQANILGPVGANFSVRTSLIQALRLETEGYGETTE